MRKSLIYALVLLAMLVFAGSARAGTSYDDSNVVITDTAIYPKTDGALTVGKSGNEFSNGYFDSLTVGGSVYTSFKGVNYAADTSSSDDYVVTLTPAPAALTPGMTVTFWAKTANTGACTLNVNGLGAKPIKVMHDQDASDNWIEASSMVMCVFDGNNFQMLNYKAN